MAAYGCASLPHHSNEPLASRAARGRAANAVFSRGRLTGGRVVKVYRVWSQPCRFQCAMTCFGKGVCLFYLVHPTAAVLECSPILPNVYVSSVTTIDDFVNAL